MQVRRTASGATTLTEFCVYTIVSRDRLDPVALEHATFINQESRTWRAAIELLAEGESSA